MRRQKGAINYKIPPALVLSVLVIAGCSSNNSSEPGNVMPTESVTDAGDVTTSDAGTVSSTDAGTVTGTDAGIVTDTDAGTVTDTDAGTVTGTDAGTVTGTDAGTVTGTDAGTVTGTDAGTVTGTDAGPVDGTDSGPDVGTTDAGTISGGTSSPTIVGAANCAALSASGSSANIAGLYDITETVVDGVVDVAYLEISNNGTLTFYDYQQDDFGQGDNCYEISLGDSVISPLGNDEYVNSYYDDADVDCEISTEQATVIRTETELTATYIDTEDEDQDGDTTDLVSDVLPVVTNFTTESFNRCE